MEISYSNQYTILTYHNKNNNNSRCCTATISCCTRPDTLFSPSVCPRICPRSGPACSSRSGRTRPVWPDWPHPARPAASSKRRPPDYRPAPRHRHRRRCPRHSRHTWSPARTPRSGTRRTRGRTWACSSRTGASPPASGSRPPAGPPEPHTPVCPGPSRYRRCIPFGRERPCRACRGPSSPGVPVTSSSLPDMARTVWPQLLPNYY